MNSQPNADVKLTETERVAIRIESRISSLTAAVYFLTTVVLAVGTTLGASTFHGEIAALDSDARELIGWLLYLPVAAFVVGAYYLGVAHWLRGRLFQ